MSYDTGALGQQQGGMNDHIISQSFITDMDDPAIQGGSGYVDSQQNFELDPQHIEGEFTNVAPKSPFKKKLIVASLCGLGFLGAVAGALQMPQVKGFIDGSPAVSVAAASPMSAPVAQVPANLGGLAEKAPASLLPPQDSAVAPVLPVAAGSTVVLPSVAAQAPAAQIPAEPTPVAAVASVAPPSNSLGSPQPAPASLAAPASLGAPQAVGSSPVATVTPQPVAVQVPAPAAPQVVAATPSPSPIKPVAVKSEAPAAPAASIVKAEAPVATKQDAKPVTKQIASAPTKSPASTKKETGEQRVAAAGDDGVESVKPLVTFSAGQIGLRSLSPDTLVLVSSKTNAATRYRVGDSLPSGDVIQHLDSNAMTVVTNRKVIRIIN